MSYNILIAGVSTAPDIFVFVINNPHCLKDHNKRNDLLQEKKNKQTEPLQSDVKVKSFKVSTLSFVVTVMVWCCPVAAWRRPSPVATEVWATAAVVRRTPRFWIERRRPSVSTWADSTPAECHCPLFPKTLHAVHGDTQAQNDSQKLNRPKKRWNVGLKAVRVEYSWSWDN